MCYLHWCSYVILIVSGDCNSCIVPVISAVLTTLCICACFMCFMKCGKSVFLCLQLQEIFLQGFLVKYLKNNYYTLLIMYRL